MAPPLPLSPEHEARLRDLIARHRLEPIADVLLAHARPCITLMLAQVEDAPERPAPPVGSSFVGGLPDLPHGFDWPVFICGYSQETVHAGFLLQIDLATVAPWTDGLLPPSGLLSVFHRDQCADFAQSFEVHVFTETAGPLQRAAAPPAVPCASEAATCLDGRSFALVAQTGLDVPDKGQDDVLRELAFERFAHEPADDDDWWGQRLSQLRLHALDERHDERSHSGRPFHWWHVGQLLGRLDRASEQALAGDADGTHAWRLLLQIETNAVTGFAGPCDTAPVLIAVDAAGGPLRSGAPLGVQARLAP